MSRVTTDRLLPLKEVMAITRISGSKIYRMMRSGSFPRPRKLGLRAVRWLESEIQDWMANCPRATGDTPP